VVFNSLTFVVFFVIVLLLHNLPFSWSVKKFNLLVASYLFYAAWNPPFILLLWASTVTDWVVARQMHRQTDPRRRKAWLLFSLFLNLGFLGFFKYWKFALENWQALMAVVGVHYQPPAWDILLPVGISFYTFHSLAYMLDVYWKRAEPIPKLADYALFIAFFTQLVAGPILRKGDLVPQFEHPRTATLDQFCWGLALMTFGLFEKVVLADGALAPAVDAVYGNEDPVGVLDAWIGTMGFSAQMFCDFAGYSTIAIGAALCLGFNIPNNFNAPYGAIGFSDYWRRWHMSLSSWLRDYIYFPLGGSKKGDLRAYANLMTTMLVGGIWHGASWNFVIWGGTQGAFLCGERWLKRATGHWTLPPWVKLDVLLLLCTFILNSMTRAFYRSGSLSGALSMLGAMFNMHPGAAAVLPTVQVLGAALCIGGLLIAHWYMREREFETVVTRAPRLLVGAAWSCMAFLIIITQGSGDAFLYFQF
jgi:D-alanyl-lipoteichoic acid acyltransferase DltB (MBOAT superfamily)